MARSRGKGCKTANRLRRFALACRPSPVVQLDDVVMLVRHGFVPVRVAVGFGAFPAFMGVLMMPVVNMPVRMLQRFVLVL